MDVMLRIFAAIGFLSTLAFGGLVGWVSIGWWEDRRSRKRVPTLDQLTDADCARLLADLEAWDRGERPLLGYAADLHDVEEDGDE